MAIASGTVSTEAKEVKKYIGIAPVFILDVNPNKETLEKMYGTTMQKEPEYFGVKEEGDETHKVNVKYVRLSFIAKTDAEKCKIELTTPINLFLRNTARMNKTGSKVQVIDKYGRTAWVTNEELRSHTIPTYSNGNKANIDADYRPAYVGEEELTDFIKSYLNIPNVQSYINNEWVPNPDVKPEDCEARLDHIADYFNGDINEIKSVIKLQPNNKLKVMMGVQTADDGKQYQAIYTRMFLKNNVNSYTRIEKHYNDAVAAGAYANVEFKAEDLKEYSVAATDLSKSPANGDLPFDAPAW